MSALWLIAGVALWGTALLVLRRWPRRWGPRWLDTTLALIALAALGLAGVPRAEISFGAISNEEKDALARRWLEPGYGFARQLIEGCGAFRGVSGELESLTISPRHNFARKSELGSHAFLDFDYVGRSGRGRVTVAVFKHPGAASYSAIAPVPGDAGSDRAFTLFVHPDGGAASQQVACPPLP